MKPTLPNTIPTLGERTPLDWEEVVADAVRNRAGDRLLKVLLGPDMLVLIIEPEAIRDVAEILRHPSPEAGFPFLLDVTAVDYLVHSDPHPERFAVVWHFLDRQRGRRLRVKAYVGEGTPVPSLSDMYPAANWSEREVYDMMGITFSGHPNMIRILMPYDYEGHPQRKDFPIQGPERAKPIHGELLGNKPLSSWKELHEL